MTAIVGCYVALDASGAALYVGATFDVAERLDQHRHRSAWWARVADFAIYPTKNKEEALNLEPRLIAEYAPHVNVRRGHTRLAGTAALQIQLRPGVIELCIRQFGNEFGLAEALGVSQSTVNRHRRNERTPSRKFIARLMNLTRRDFDELFEEVDAA